MARRAAAQPKTLVTAYSEDVATAILTRIANGEPLRVICREAGMPGKDIVYEWRRGLHGAPEDFRARMEAARVQGADALRDEMLEIADTVAADRDAVAKAKLRIDTREKLLARWFPPQVEVKHSGMVRWAMTPGEAVQDVADAVQATEQEDDDDF